MLMIQDQYELANKCCVQSIMLMPGDSEAYINLNNIMRQLGKKHEAFEYVWLQMEKQIV